MRILHIDDDPDVLTMVEEMLVQHGHTITSTTDVRYGMMLAHNETPDLILIDYNMPMMTGAQVTNLLRRAADTRHIPVIGISAQLNMLGQLHALGCDTVLSKPVSRLELLEAIEHVMTLR